MNRFVVAVALCVLWPVHAVAQVSSGVLGSAQAVDLNVVGETAITVSASRYQLRGLLLTGCTEVDNAGVLGGGIHTAPNGGGVQVGQLGPAWIVDSTAPPNHPELIHDVRLITHPENLPAVQTAQTLYVRVTAARGAPMACDFVVVGDVLP